MCGSQDSISAVEQDSLDQSIVDGEEEEKQSTPDLRRELQNPFGLPLVQESHQRAAVGQESHQRAAIRQESQESHQRTAIRQESHQRAAICQESYQRAAVEEEGPDKLPLLQIYALFNSRNVLRGAYLTLEEAQTAANTLEPEGCWYITRHSLALQQGILEDCTF